MTASHSLGSRFEVSTVAAGLQHLAYQRCQQAALTSQRHAIRSGPLDQSLRPTHASPAPPAAYASPAPAPARYLLLPNQSSASILPGPRPSVADPQITPLHKISVRRAQNF